MKRSSWLVILSVLLILLSGCGGDDDNSGDDDASDGDSATDDDDDDDDDDTSDGDEDGDTDDDDDDTSDGDTDDDDDDTTDGDTDDDDDDTTDGDTDGDVDGDEECLCTTTDSCCDGCQPINEEGDCTLDGGHGACREGECVPRFGECDARSYGQDTLYPCNMDAECQSGLCMKLDGWNTYCSQSCDHDTPCPEGMLCKDQGDERGFVCEVQSKTSLLPADGSQETFRVCNQDSDCEGGLCLAYGTQKFCTKDCESQSGGSANQSACGSCGRCRDGGTESGFAFEYYCVPDGELAVGVPCELAYDCESGLCWEGYCSGSCFIIGSVDTCPDGNTCLEDFYNGDTEICVHDSLLNHALGEDCTDDYQCAEGTCERYFGHKICSTDCTDSDCASGVCTVVDESSVNTKLTLLLEGATEPLTETTYGGDYPFAALEQAVTESGTYIIRVTGSSETVSGYYHLVVSTSNDSVPSLTDETEPNDDDNNAQDLTLPVNVFAFLTEGETDTYRVSITTDEEITLSVTTQAADLKACLPERILGVQGYGEACQGDVECKEGFVCYDHLCTKECVGDEDCPNGMCFGFSDDELYCVSEDRIGGTAVGRDCTYDFECEEGCFDDQVTGDTYCSIECTDTLDCAPGMTCFDGLCVHPVDTSVFPYQNCRVDDDCDTGVCYEGRCSQSCTESTDCSGGEAFTPAQYDICHPCTTNEDCNADSTTSNICLSNGMGESFCGTDCYNHPEVCPEGTRCWPLDYLTAYCAPVTLSCNVTARCSDDSMCLRPSQSLSAPCSDSAECVEGNCLNNFCQTDNACENPVDCGCEDLTCESGACAVNLGTEDVAEVESNSTPDTAQTLDAATERVFGTLAPENSNIDNDFYAITLQAGQALDLQTSAFCGNNPDTLIALRNAQGELIEGFVNDDIDYYGGNLQSFLQGYVSESGETVIIQVTQSNYASSLLYMSYILNVRVYDAVANNTCDTAETLSDGLLESDLYEATNTMANGTCVQYTATGKDRFYSVSVPANHMISATLESDFDGQLLLLSGCGAEDSCIKGSDANHSEPTETLVYANTSDQTEDLILVVDSFLSVGSMNFDLTLETVEITAPDNDLAETAIYINQTDVTLHGRTIGANDDYDPGAEGCSGAMPGNDVVYRLNFNDGYFFVATLSADFAATMYLVEDPSDMSTCIESSTSRLMYVAEEEPAPDKVGYDNHLYLIIDAASADALGVFTLSVDFEELGICSGPCDSSTHVRACTTDDEPEDAVLCLCDGTTGLYNPIDCNEYCTDNGAISGSCIEPEAEGTQPGCLCIEGCDNVQAMCSAGTYNNCTCAVDDPCGWQGDGTCDAFCATLFPDASFDDSTDCAE